MKNLMATRNIAATALLALATVAPGVHGAGRGARQAVAVANPVEARVDALFERFDSNTSPGCVVAVDERGSRVLSRAYGMADLEHDVRNTPGTIFEAGSVAKQFTAMAVLLLAQEGRLSLDDPVRKHVPELPAHNDAVTLRHMLHHTSGLRDWGSVAAIGGWPRTTRAHTHAHVLDILTRQGVLNFQPGTQWSYSNSGYNLAAIVVSRVSGRSFAEYTRQRIFEPLGMTSTSWRDDHTRVVPGRAMAYVPRPGEAGRFSTQMPFENVHGNGGLLTTVGDLLSWNRNFKDGKVGGRDMLRALETPGQLSGGRPHGYALGLVSVRHRGHQELGHGGATAGYRAYLARYPEPDLSVALLCNVGNAGPEQLTRSVADLFLGPEATSSTDGAKRLQLTAAQLEARAGLYLHRPSNDVLTLVIADGGLRMQDGPSLSPVTGSRFTIEGGTTFDFDSAGPAAGALRVTFPFGLAQDYQRVERVTPTQDVLATLAGTYQSDEAETTFVVRVEGGALTLTRRPDSADKLTPLHADAFASPIGTVRFHRDAAGRVRELGISESRVWDLRFARQ